MKKILFTILVLATLGCQLINAKSENNELNVKNLEEKCSIIIGKQANTEKELRKLAEKYKESERSIQNLELRIGTQCLKIDSLQKVCKSLEGAQSIDREKFNGKIEATDSSVRDNKNKLQNRTLWGFVMIVVLLFIIAVIAFYLKKRIKLGVSTIDDVRKAQDALQVAQSKMQEDSVKLDNQILALIDKQMSASSVAVSAETDHSLALKVADEIVRIELNLSRMDASVKGYKQLSKAVERIKNNFAANGYEIVDMLGKQYNEGMKVVANFVPDETLKEGEQVITGVTKPQINYNGKMIQSAQITVSQNI